jgi:hypothetical protein
MIGFRSSKRARRAAVKTMDELTISPPYVRRLILMARAVMAQEALVTPDGGGNPTDDEEPETLQAEPDNLTREELYEELEGLDVDHQNELVALMWLGRGDAEPEDWSALVKQADELHETPTPHYLLDHPHLADHWAEALERLGY